MFRVDAADAAHPIVGEEFALVEEAGENRRQHGVIDQRQEMLAPLVLPVGAGTHVVPAKGSALVLPKLGGEARHVGEQPTVDDLGGEQRDQADHRVDVDAVMPAVGGDDQILEEPGLGIPQRNAAVGMSADGVGDGQELLQRLDGDILVVRILGRQLERHHRHVEGEHRHPAGGVRLLQAVAGRHRLRAVEHRDVVEAEKTALEHVMAVGVLAVDPPGVIEQQLVEDALEKTAIGGSPLHPLGAEHLERAQGMDRRVDVREVPFVGGNLPVGVEVDLLQHQLDLVLGEIDVDQRQRGAVKRQIPGGEPRVFPAVRHRDDVGGLEVLPLPVAAEQAARRRRKPVAVEPVLDVVMEELLAPDHPGQGLAHDPMVLRARFGEQVVVEDVGFRLAGGMGDLAAGERSERPPARTIPGRPAHAGPRQP